jgi:hypothetical protein
MRQSTSLQLAKVSLIALGAIAKCYRIICRANCKRNPPTACNADHVSNVNCLEAMFTVCGFYTHEGLPNHTTFRQI